MHKLGGLSCLGFKISKDNSNVSVVLRKKQRSKEASDLI